MTDQTILIVDDEPFNVDYLEQELQDQGYRTLSAGNGLAALEAVQASQPDLVLLDIMMPGMDGFEVLTRLKADPQQRHLPVVIISAMSDLDSVVRGIELGAEDYLPSRLMRLCFAPGSVPPSKRNACGTWSKPICTASRENLRSGIASRSTSCPPTCPRSPAGTWMPASARRARSPAISMMPSCCRMAKWSFCLGM